MYPAFFTKKLEEIQAEAQVQYLEEHHRRREQGLDVSTEVGPDKAAERMLRQAQGEEDEPKPNAPEPFAAEGSDTEEEEAAAACPKPLKGKGSKGEGQNVKGRP